MSKIYVASSWRCAHQPGIVNALRIAGHDIYDFRHPSADTEGFHWSEINPSWENWTPQEYRICLEHLVAKRGFSYDFDAMKWADLCVLVLPCGRSAHLEAGWFAGAGKPLHILLLEKCEPELMYKMAASICVSVAELLARCGG